MIKIIYIYFIFFVVFNSSICAKWVSENTQTRGKSCNSIFSSSKHASLRSKMSALPLYSLIASLQSDKSHNSTKHKAMNRIESEGWVCNWRHMTSSAFFSLVLFPSPWDISEAEKAVFGGRNSRNTFAKHIFKAQIVKSWSPGQEVLPQPRTWLEQQDWFTVQITK